MAGTIPITSERGKELRNLHPLYTRLSGDVIWALFEDAGLDQDQCGKAMDETIGQMHAVLEVMDRLEKDEARYFGIVAHEGGAANLCRTCAGLSGTAVSTARPDWRRFLPPYAVGCGLGCEALAGDAAESLPPLPDDADPPVCGLLCENFME